MKTMLTSQNVDSFLTFLRESAQQNSIAYDNLSETEQQIQDILHSIEFGEYNTRLTNRLTKRIQEVQIKRREAKKVLEFTDVVIAWLSDNKQVVKSLERLLGELRKVEKRQETRIYSARTDIMEGLKN